MSTDNEINEQDSNEIEDALKIGARNSRNDAQRLQIIHDYSVENGAKCGPEDDAEKSLIWFGDAVKALGDGKVGGYLVRFSTALDPDLSGDFFTPATDFGGASKSDVYYQHGMDAKVGKRKIGEADLRFDDVGAWAEAQLNMRDEYEKAIYKLAQKGKLGWSSGTAAHLVDRQPEGKAQRILKWPLGLDASLTPTPAEPRNAAIPLKSYQPQLLDVDALPETEQENRSAEPTLTAADSTQIKSLGANEMAEETKVEAAPEVVSVAEFKALAGKIDTIENSLKREKPEVKGGFSILKEGTGDSEYKSFGLYLRKGVLDENYLKASNAVDMQEGTNGEGGYAVPTGLYNQIVARKSEMSLSDKLGLRPIPGKGLTVNVPIDDEADGEFVATTEESATDKDTPAINQVAMTMLKYTKKMLFSWELLEDEDANLMGFISDWIARGIAKTQNSLILTAVASGGTALKTFASATAIAVGELESLIYNSNVTYYLDDSASCAFVMRPSVYDAIAKLGSTSLRWYTPQVQGNNSPIVQPTLLGYPVLFSEKAAATAASAKDVYFGNWNFVGKREGSGLTVIRDPYSNAATGQMTLHYYFRAVYKPLQAAAIGYGVHPSA